ncbi:hypothetical protein Drorol1_Dr00014450 [Drosera rotundifolia]
MEEAAEEDGGHASRHGKGGPRDAVEEAAPACKFPRLENHKIRWIKNWSLFVPLPPIPVCEGVYGVASIANGCDACRDENKIYHSLPHQFELGRPPFYGSDACRDRRPAMTLQRDF